MADRTSAGIFGDLFVYLSEQPQDERTRAFALKTWADSQGYDFSHYQMEADEALIKLGLAKRGVDPDWPDDGETILYADGDGTFPNG